MKPNDLQVIYEDNHLLAINKPSGELVQGDRTGDLPLTELAKAFLKAKYNKPGEVYLGLPHRLDRPTSGALVFCKTSKSLPRMNKLFETKNIQKVYWAVVKNKPPKPADTLVHYLRRDQSKNKSFAHLEERKNTKKAELDYRVLKKLDHYYLIEVTPKTGRHHQIRTQLAAIKCPIKGDLKYGFDRSNKDGSIHLHARSISFVHPVSQEETKIVATCPKEDAIWRSCEQAE